MTRSKKQTLSGNYLDMVPIYHDECKYEISEQKEVTIFVENKGVFNRIAQLLFKRPKVSQIHLDTMGNFIWPLIDGERTIFDIAECVKQEFGEKAEPLYQRIAQYFKTLESYGFVQMK